MLLRAFLFSIGLTAFTYATASAQSKKFEYSDKGLTEVDALFIGEVHGIRDGRQFWYDAIRHAYEKFGITDVVLELGKSEAYLFNAYLQRGDTSIFEEYGSGKEIMGQLTEWKDLYNDCHIALHGIDFDRIEFVVAVRSIMRRYPEAANTPLSKYLCSLPPSVMDISDGKDGAKERIRIYTKAKDIFKQEKAALQQVLKADYATVEDIMESPATEKKFNQRDKGMAENLLQLRKQGDGRFLCIAGLGHTTMRKKSALINRFIEGAPGANVAVIDMVCKNCYITSYFGSNVLWPIVADYYEKNEDAISGLIDKHYKNDVYMLVNQKEVVNFKGGYNTVPTYYAVFRDQPKVTPNP
jgi:hypothetical protein